MEFTSKSVQSFRKLAETKSQTDKMVLINFFLVSILILKQKRYLRMYLVKAVILQYITKRLKW